jgi:hypothetical protein
MALTQPQRIQISGEQLDIPLKVQAAADTQAQLAGVKADLLAKDGSLQIFFDKWNGLINSYQDERKYVDGSTYATVTNQDCVDSAQKIPSNKFFPTDGSWIKFQPKKHSSAEGLPTTVFANNEIAKTTELTSTLDLMKNGQASGVADDTLAMPYTPGSGTMTVTAGGQTIGKMIIVDGGGFSGLFMITNVALMVLTVTELIPPGGILPATTSDVKENIPGFTNSERNTLTSGSYQTVLTGLANNAVASVLAWETAIDSQLTALNSNTDSRSPQAGEITNAKNDITNAKGIIDAWQALPLTGSSGSDSKFTNNNLLTLTNEVTARGLFSTTRNAQIGTALGSITQNPDGTFTGVGLFHERFKQIDLRINLAGGPLTEYYEKGMADAALSQIAATATSTATSYNTELRTEKLTANGNGTNVVTVASVTGFANGNTVFVMADTLTELTGTISSINGLNITLSFTVPNTYTAELKARIYKQL